MTRYNPPKNVIPNFNPVEFQPAVSTSSGGISTIEVTELAQKVGANSLLINSIQNSLLNLGGNYTVKSLSGIMSPNSATSLTTTVVPAGTYILSYNITFCKNPFPATEVYSFTTATVQVNNGDSSIYNQNIQPTAARLGGNDNATISGACVCVYSTAAIIDLKLTINSTYLVSNSWQYGNLGFVVTSPLASPAVNCYRLVRLK
jgi:hypothetical protein